MPYRSVPSDIATYLAVLAQPRSGLEELSARIRRLERQGISTGHRFRYENPYTLRRDLTDIHGEAGFDGIYDFAPRTLELMRKTVAEHAAYPAVREAAQLLGYRLDRAA